jgi:hypothetical protein
MGFLVIKITIKLKIKIGSKLKEFNHLKSFLPDLPDLPEPGWCQGYKTFSLFVTYDPANKLWLVL